MLKKKLNIYKHIKKNTLIFLPECLINIINEYYTSSEEVITMKIKNINSITLFFSKKVKYLYNPPYALVNADNIVNFCCDYDYYYKKEKNNFVSIVEKLTFNNIKKNTIYDLFDNNKMCCTYYFY